MITSKSTVPSWTNTKLGDVIELKYGKALPAKTRDGVGHPVYGSNGVVGKHSEPLLGHPGLIVGRKGSFGEVHISKVPFSPIDTTYFVDELYGQPLEYWFYFLRYLPLTELNRSTAIPGLNREDAYSLPISLPGVEEQKQIAAKLDELLAQVDSIKTRLDAIPAILKRFRQSVLAAAVSGRLTEDWRDASGSSGWLQKTIGDIADVATGKTPKRSNSQYWQEGDIPWLTSASTGQEFCDFAEQYVTALAVKECTLKIFPVGTLLLAMYGEGKTRGQVTELRISTACNQACAALTIDESQAVKDYVKLRLEENYEETRKAAAGGAQPNLNLQKVRDISIPLPNIDEQREIVRRAKLYFAFLDQIASRLEVAEARMKRVPVSLLAKAFRGDLTADWRKQNPDLITGEHAAEALLQRIKTERAAVKPSKRRRKKAV